MVKEAVEKVITPELHPEESEGLNNQGEASESTTFVSEEHVSPMAKTAKKGAYNPMYQCPPPQNHCYQPVYYPPPGGQCPPTYQPNYPPPTYPVNPHDSGRSRRGCRGFLQGILACTLCLACCKCCCCCCEECCEGCCEVDC